LSYTPKHIARWREQINYTGESFDDYYIAAWRFFRCTPCERSNFLYVKEHLVDCGDTKGIEEVAFSDEVMMSRYYIFVHQDNERALRMADMFAERVKRKGSLDPEQEERMCYVEVHKRWHLAKLHLKAAYCHEAGISIFAARSYDFPSQHPKADALFAVIEET
jgi:hypothetical protein